MFDEWLVSRLSKNAWALLGALLLLRRHESHYTNAELAIRAAMSKGSVVEAKQELVMKGLVTIIERSGQPSVIQLNIETEGFANEPTTDMGKIAGTSADTARQIQAARVQAPDILGRAVRKFNEAFPGAKLDEATAKRMVELAGSEDRFLYAIDQTVEKQPQSPRGYLHSICKNTDRVADDTPIPPPAELVAFTQRAREHAKGQSVRSIEDRRARAKKQSS